MAALTLRPPSSFSHSWSCGLYFYHLPSGFPALSTQPRGRVWEGLGPRLERGALSLWGWRLLSNTHGKVRTSERMVLLRQGTPRMCHWPWLEVSSQPLPQAGSSSVSSHRPALPFPGEDSPLCLLGPACLQSLALRLSPARTQWCPGAGLGRTLGPQGGPQAAPVGSHHHARVGGGLWHPAQPTSRGERVL